MNFILEESWAPYRKTFIASQVFVWKDSLMQLSGRLVWMVSVNITNITTITITNAITVMVVVMVTEVCIMQIFGLLVWMVSVKDKLLRLHLLEALLVRCLISKRKVPKVVFCLFHKWFAFITIYDLKGETCTWNYVERCDGVIFYTVTHAKTHCTASLSLQYSPDLANKS